MVTVLEPLGVSVELPGAPAHARRSRQESYGTVVTHEYTASDDSTALVYVIGGLQFPLDYAEKRSDVDLLREAAYHLVVGDDAPLAAMALVTDPRGVALDIECQRADGRSSVYRLLTHRRLVVFAGARGAPDAARAARARLLDSLSFGTT
jgi:hypothetical protein